MHVMLLPPLILLCGPALDAASWFSRCVLESDHHCPVRTSPICIITWLASQHGTGDIVLIQDMTDHELLTEAEIKATAC